MSAELTQNEIFQLLGNYPTIPDEAGPDPGQDELTWLAGSIRANGIHRTASAAAAFRSPIIRFYLKLMDSGVPPSVVRIIAGETTLISDSGISPDAVHEIFEPAPGRSD